MFSKYYQDELEYLRRLGPEFAREKPEIAHFLDITEPGSDPDVERLLEGVAFLTGRIREKLDDELPEIIHSLFELLWPHYLRPIPSLTMVEFLPREQLSSRATIPRVITELDSEPVDETRCRFRTCYDVEVAPIGITDIHLETPPAAALELHVRLAALGRTPIARVGIERLRFHAAGDPTAARDLHACLCRDTREIEVRAGGGVLFTLRGDAVRTVGFRDDESLWPYPPYVLPGYRLLQEYFAFPAKFLFIDVVGLGRLAATTAERECTLVFRFDRPPGRVNLRDVTGTSLLLHCTPAVNLFARTADPLTAEHRKTEYMVRPAGDPTHYEVYSVDQVVGLVRGTGERKAYLPFYSFRPGAGSDRSAVYYHTRRRPALGMPNSETTIGFVSETGAGAVPETETISLDLTCTNRTLTAGLRAGDVTVATETAPVFAKFRNVAGVTGSVVPPLEGDLLWRLVSHLGLNYLSLDGREGGVEARDALRSILALYNVPAVYDRQAARAAKLRLDGITNVRCEPKDRLVRGTPVRGTHVHVDVREEGFGGEGDIYLFGSVLADFFAAHATANSFAAVTIRGLTSGETYQWPAKLGSQPLV
jgi:type VI secretion system protein ImpG